MDYKETIINNYETAPLIELEDYKCPEGGKGFFIKGFDGKKLRIAIWNIGSNNGTIILQSGRTEFIEKYKYNEKNYAIQSPFKNNTAQI